MKRILIICGCLLLGALSICAGVLGIGINDNKAHVYCVQDAVASPVVENVAYLPEHFMWNAFPQFVSGGTTQLPIGTVVTGLIESYRELPNLHVSFPEGTIGITHSVMDGGFANRRNIIEVTIPASVERMDSTLFTNTGLVTVTVLPGSALQNSLAAFLFRGAPLRYINWEGDANHQVINNTVVSGTRIEIGSASGYIPPGITSMNNNAFDGRGISGEFFLPASVQSLGQDVFMNNNITTLTIESGSNLGNVGNAFANNPLATINFEGSPSLELRDGNIVTRFGNSIMLGTTAGYIPHGTTGITWGAFQGRGLTGTIVFPNTLTNIAQQAFMGNSIDTLFFRGNLPTLGPVVFAGSNVRHIRFGRGTTNIDIAAIRDLIEQSDLETIIIPASVVNAFSAPRRMATIWGMTNTVEDWMNMMGGVEVTIDGHQYVEAFGERGRIFEVGFFGDSPNLVIYTEHPSRPENWHEGFNFGTSGIVVWGHQMWSDITLDTTELDTMGQGEVAVEGDFGNYLTQVTIGDERRFIATPWVGWEFVRFEVTENGITTNHTSNVLLIEMGTADIFITPVFQPITYNITYILDGGMHSGNPATFTINDLNVQINAATRYGFNFLGWYLQSDFSGVPVTQVISIGDIRLYARWSDPLVSNITYNNLRDTDVHMNPPSFFASDLPIILSGVTRNGWTFHGWYRDESFTEPVTQIIAFGDVSIYANLSINGFEVSFENLQGATHSNETVFTVYSPITTLSDPSVRNGWTFGGWWTSPNGTGTQWTDVPVGVVGSQALYAHWTLNEYTIVFDNLNGGMHPNPSVFNVETATIVLVDAVREGYRFDGWWTQLIGGSTVTQVAVGSFGDMRLYARWFIDFYDEETGIRVEEGSDREIIVTIPGEPDTVIVVNPENVLVVTISPPNDDIVVDGPNAEGEITITISGEYDDEETVIIIRPGENPPVTIILPQVRFSVAFDSMGGTPVNSQRIDAGGLVSRPTSTRTLYRFLGWFDNGEMFDFATPVTRAKTLSAVWERMDIDTGDTGIIVEPGDTDDNDNPGQDGDIVIIIPSPDDDGDDTVIIVRPNPDNDGEYDVVISPPNDDIIIGGPNTEGEIIITIPGGDDDYDDENTVIIIRPGEDPPVVIHPPVIRFNVSFDSLGGSLVNIQRIERGGLATQVSSTRTLYRFMGWLHNDGTFDFATPITQAKNLSAIWERMDIDTGDTGIIVEPGDTGDNDNPGQDDDIVITVPGDPDTIITVRPGDNDPVYVYPPNNNIIIDDSNPDEIVITIPGDYDDEYIIITVRPGEDPPVTIQTSTPRFTVSFDSGCGIEIPSQRVTINTVAVMPTPTRVLHRLSGWSLLDSGDYRALFDFGMPINQRTELYAVWERMIIDDAGTGIIVEPGDTDDNDNPGRDEDIVITIPDDAGEDTVIIIGPDSDNDGEYKVIITPPDDDITVDRGDDGEIIITIPDRDGEGEIVIIVRPGYDPPVIITVIPPDTDPGDNTEPDPSVSLAVPTDLVIVLDRWLLWTGDERADGFSIYVNDEYWTTLLRRHGHRNQVDLVMFEEGVYTFRVRAISETVNIYDSEVSDYVTFYVGPGDEIGIPPYPGDVLPDPEPELENRLPSPTSLSISNKVLTWSGVHDATGFAVYVNGIRLQLLGDITYIVEEGVDAEDVGLFSYSFDEHDIGEGMVILAVRALGDGIDTNDSSISLGVLLSIEPQEPPVLAPPPDDDDIRNWMWILLLVGALLIIVLILLIANRKPGIVISNEDQ